MEVRANEEEVKPLTHPFGDRPTPLGSLLTAAGQRLSGELDASLREAGFPDLRAAHAPIFLAIDPAGTRVTDLAVRTKMTKQAAGELIRYLTGCGYLTVSTHVEDRRVRVISLTPRGWQAVQVGERVVDDFDRWLVDLVGAAEVVQLRQILTRIADPDARPRHPTPEGRSDVGRDG